MYMKRALVALAITVSSFSAYAAPALNSDNGHYYEVFSFADTGRLDWNQAKAFAENSVFNGSHGYLATVTSKQEDDFLWGLGAEGTFLGAFDHSTYVNGTLQHNQWQWVSGETFAYNNWVPGENNNWQDGSDLTANNEDYLMYWWSPVAGDNGRWNDTNIDSSWMDGSTMKYTTRGFVVEYGLSIAPVPVTSVPLPAPFLLFASGLAFFVKRKKGNRSIA